VLLDDNVDDDIGLMLTAKGQYLAQFTYEVQFLVSISSTMYMTVWKSLGSPKRICFYVAPHIK
jgi:hypothetical protein